MKNFVFILVSLFFVNLHAQTPTAPGVNVNLTPDAADKYLDNQNLENDKRQCTDAYKEYSDLKKEAIKEGKKNKEEAEGKLTELKTELAEKTADAQEQIAEAEEREQKAVIAYSEAKQALQDQLDEVEKNANEQGQALVKEIQELVTALEKNLTVDRDEVNTEFQNSIMQRYEACKQAAEAQYMAAVGIIKDTNKKENGGYVFSGAASLSTPSTIKKAKKQALAKHKTCVSETKRVLESKRDATLQKMALEEKRLNQEIEAKQKELNRITNDEYKKKLESLNVALKNAELALISAQEKATKDKQRLAQKMSTDQTTLQNEIALVSARANTGIDSKGKKAKGRIDISDSDEAAEEALASSKEACCEAKEGKFTGTLKYPGTRANSEICKKRNSSRSSNRSNN